MIFVIIGSAFCRSLPELVVPESSQPVSKVVDVVSIDENAAPVVRKVRQFGNFFS